MKRKICVVITARPSYSRIRTTLFAIKNNPNLELQIVVSASALIEKYGSVVEIMKKDGFQPDDFVYMVIEGSSASTTAKSTGLAVMELATIFHNKRPDIVVSIADRYETMATAIAASYSNIPLAHVQGGEVTGSIDEKVRHAITKLSDIHLVSNDDSAKRVEKLGELRNKIFITGCPSIDLAKDVSLENFEIFNPFNKYLGIGNKFNIDNSYYVMMQHPVTTQYKKSGEHILETLNSLKELNFPTFIFWPNVDAGTDIISKNLRIFLKEVTEKKLNFYFYKNLKPKDFLRLINSCKCLIGNSSVGIREASYLGVPVVNIGDRQNKRQRHKNVIDVNYNKLEILDAISVQHSKGKYVKSNLYGNGNSGNEIAKVLETVEMSISKTITY